MKSTQGRISNSGIRRTESRLAAIFQLDNLGPGLIVAIALIISLEPKLFGAEISGQRIILALFGLLGVDAIIERTGRLAKLERKLDALSQQLAGPVGASQVLKTRASFERMDVLLREAKRSIAIIGINLEGYSRFPPKVQTNYG